MDRPPVLDDGCIAFGALSLLHFHLPRVPDERGVGGMAWTLRFEMAVLLRPELAIDSAAFEQNAVRRDIDHLSLVQNQGLVAFGQRRQPVRHDDHRPTARDAQQVGVDQRLAFRVERAGGLVEDQDPRIVDQRARDGEALAWPPDRLGEPSSM